MQLAIFSDFDGTITVRDSLDALIEAFVGADRQRFDTLFLEEGRPLWEVLDASLQACAVSLEEAIAFLQANVALDPSFESFHRFCRRRAIPLRIVSAGVAEIIESYLSVSAIDVPVLANRATRLPGCFGLQPSQADCPMGIDKGSFLAAARQEGSYAVFIGDGFSDRLAVKEADLVYAKASLARYCAEKAIPFVPFERFEDVQADLARRFALE